MDGFTGFKTATAEELPDAVAVMDPFHVVRLAGDALDRCRRRVQQAIHGHRGRKDDPLYSRPADPAHRRRPAHRQADATDSHALFAADEHVEVEATWGIYQRMIAAYREPDRSRRPEADAAADRLGQPRRPRRARRAHHARPDPEEARRRRPGLLRPARHQQRTDRGDQRPTRTPPRLRPRVPQPHQLHRQITARDRRLQTPTTPSSPVPRSPASGSSACASQRTHLRASKTPSSGRSGPSWTVVEASTLGMRRPWSSKPPPACWHTACRLRRSLRPRYR